MPETFKRAVCYLLLILTLPTVCGTNCSSFKFESSNSKSISSTYFKAGARVNISNLFQAIDTDILPEFCRIQVNITTNATADSIAAAEVWLPSDWNGRILAIGNGALAGGGEIRYYWVSLLEA